MSRGRPSSSQPCTTRTRASGSAASTSETWCRRSGARRTDIRSSRRTTRRASRWCASAGMSTRSSCCSRPCGRSGRRHSRSRCAQIAVVALGALPVFWLADGGSTANASPGSSRSPTSPTRGSRRARTAAIHPVTFAITFLLFCVWFLETERLVPFAVFALLTISTGELMGLPILALGVWFAFAHRRRRAGAAIAALGFAWTAFALFVVVPHYRTGGNAVLRLLRRRRRLAAGRAEDALDASVDGARSARRGSTTSPTSSGSRSRCWGSSSCRPASRPSRCRSCSRTGSPTSAR